MKKYGLLFFVTVFLMAGEIKAQDKPDEQKVRLGIICSPLISWGKSDASSIQADGSKFGINTGLIFDSYFAKNYAFASGISIHTLGASVNYTQGLVGFNTKDQTIDLASNTVVKYKLQYIDVPFAIKMRTTDIGNTAIFAQVGLNAMVNIKAAADINSLKISDAGISARINRFYMGYHAMLGIEQRVIGNAKLVAGIQYLNGFTDVTTDKGAATEKMVLHNVEIRVGLLF